MGRCVVNDCLSDPRKKEEGVSFHRFPIGNIAMRRKWLQLIDLQNWIPTENDRICSKHFEKKYFYKTDSRTKLLAKAIPTLFLQLPNLYQEQELKRSDSPEEDSLPSTSRKSSLKKESIDNGITYAYPILRQNQRTKMFRKNIETRKKPIIRRGISENDIETLTPQENYSSNQEDQLEFLTIIDDDDSSVSSKDGDKPLYERSLHLSPSPPPLSKSPDILNNSDHESSLAESDGKNSPFVLSSSEFDEETKEALKNRKKRTGRPRFFGDCSSDDMDDPARARTCWRIAKQTISELKTKNRLLQRKNRRLELKVECLRSLFRYLEENNFLNQYANAVIKAVVPSKAETTPF